MFASTILVMSDQERINKIGEYNLERAEARRKLGEIKVVFEGLATKFHQLGDALNPGPNTVHVNPEWAVSALTPELAQFIDGKRITDLLKSRTSLEAIVDKCSRALTHDLRVE